MPRSWSGPEIEFLIRHLGGTIKDIVTLFNAEFETQEDRNYNSIQKKVKSLRDAISAITAEVDTEEESNVEHTFEEIVEVVTPHIPHVTAAEKRAARLDAEEWLKELIEYSTREISHISRVIASDAIRSDKHSLVVVLSDLHYGKFTSHFNLGVARERMRSIPSQLRSILLPEIDEVVLISLETW